jgi:hypothetical protein
MPDAEAIAALTRLGALVFQVTSLSEDSFLLLRHGRRRAQDQRFRVIEAPARAERMEWRVTVRHGERYYVNTGATREAALERGLQRLRRLKALR